MNRKIRLIWDFYGETAQGTATHHVIHLEEFMVKENFEYHNKGTNSQSDNHVLAYITVNEKEVKIIRDALKPNRAFVEE